MRMEYSDGELCSIPSRTARNKSQVSAAERRPRAVRCLDRRAWKTNVKPSWRPLSIDIPRAIAGHAVNATGRSYTKRRGDAFGSGCKEAAGADRMSARRR